MEFRGLAFLGEDSEEALRYVQAGGAPEPALADAGRALPKPGRGELGLGDGGARARGRERDRGARRRADDRGRRGRRGGDADRRGAGAGDAPRAWTARRASSCRSGTRSRTRSSSPRSIRPSSGRRSTTRSAVERPRAQDRGRAAAALAGAGVAGYLTWAHFSDSSVLCVAGGGCETVQESEYAEIAGIPVAVLGLCSYVVVLGLVAWDSVERAARRGVARVRRLPLLDVPARAPAVRHRRGLPLVHGERRRGRAGARARDGVAAPVAVTPDDALWQRRAEARGRGRRALVRRPGHARLQPAAVRAAAHREYLRRYARDAEARRLPRHEPRAVGHGADRDPVRRGRGGARLARDLGRGRPARARAPEAARSRASRARRSEVSGARLWGAFAARHGTAERFFRERFVANYCPLLFLEESGRNRTPDRLAPPERRALFAACDEHLRALVRRARAGVGDRRRRVRARPRRGRARRLRASASARSSTPHRRARPRTGAGRSRPTRSSRATAWML